MFRNRAQNRRSGIQSEAERMSLPISSAVFIAALLAASGASFAAPEVDPSAQCIMDLPNKPEYSLIRDKVPLGDPRNITFAMLASDAVPTVTERKEIAAAFAAREECGKLGESFRQTHYPPEVNSLIQTSLTTVDLIGVDLYKGKITYGDANKRWAAARDDLTFKLTTIVQAYKKEIEAQQVKAAELAAQRAQAANQERQAAAQAAAQEEAQQEAQRQQRTQMILNYLRANRVQIAPPPQLQVPQGTTTNCTTVGGQTNCYTH
jgi:hypothetical protein